MASQFRRSRLTGLLSSLLTTSRTRPLRSNRQSKSYHDLTENLVSVHSVENLEERALLAYVDPTPEVGIFEEQGGAPVENGQVMNVSPNRQVNGAIEDVLAHPINADILYVGTINGGIWKTENATDVNPNWVPQIDDADSLSMGAIEFDIGDPTFQQLVAGTGNYSSFASAGGPRGRVYVTNDGGDTWTDPGSGRILGENISGIARRGDEIVVTSQSPGGIFRSTDGGANFTGVVDEDFIVGDNFFDLVHDDSTPGRLYAAAEEHGVYRSDDFGLTWDKITGPAIHPEMNDVITDGLNNNMEMAVHPVTGRLYLAVINASQPVGIFYTSDGETDNPIWTEMDVPILPVAPGTPVTGAEDDPAAPANGAGPPIVITAAGHGLATDDLALVFGVEGNVEANGQWTVDVLDADNVELRGSASGPVAYVANTGEIVRITNPSPSFKDIDENGSQGRIHFSITTDPSNDDLVFIGGDRQEQPNLIGDVLFGGSIFRGDVRINRNPLVVPSPQWDHVTNNPTTFDPQGGTLSNTGTHADSRDMTFNAIGELIEVDDGGIFRRTSPQDNQGDWFSLAGDIGVVEYHDIVYDTNSDVILGGTQDNGTHLQTTPDSLVWRMFSGGDGGDVIVDNVTLAASGQSIRYSSSQNLGGFRRTVWDAANNLVSSTSPALVVTDGGTFQPQFDTPIAINAVEPESMIFGGNVGIFESFNQGESLRKADNFSDIRVTGLAGNPLAYGGFSAVNGDNRWAIYAGASDGRVWVRQDAAGTFTSNTDLGDAVVDVRMNPNEWTEAFAIDTNTVSMTQDAGDSWNDITGNLLTLGARDFRSLEYISGVEDGLVVGTELGVFAMMFDHVGEWFQYGSALPNAPVWDMDYDIQDDVLIVGTLGRGAWKMKEASTFLTPKVILETDVVTIPEDGSRSATVTARLSRPSVDPIVVDFLLAGTATFVNTTSQTFAAADTPLAITDGTVVGPEVTTSTITIAESGSIQDLDVTLDLTHEDTSDLEIFLVAPDGTRVELASNFLGTAYTDTVFDDEAATSIAAGVSPYTGTFSPLGTLSDFSGLDIAGDWTLEITDTVLGFTGLLNSWSISADYQPTFYPSDYTPSAQRIIIPPGAMSDSITLTAIQDLRDEDDETIEVDAIITDAERFLLPAAPPFVQTYPSLGAVPIPDNTTITSSINVPDAGLINDLNISLDITHEFVQDLDVTLISPAGTRVLLLSAVGFDGDDFTGTTLDDEAAQSILTGTAPFAGSFIPQEALSLFDGENLSGVWTLEVTDTAASDPGTLNSWSITADASPQAQMDDVVITIIDDDELPEVTLTIDPLQTEVDEDGLDFTRITATLDALSGRDVTVNLVFSGTAEASDFNVPSQIVIPEGQMSAFIDLTATVDAVDEFNETVIVDIDNIINGVEDGVQQITTTIIDDDLPPNITLELDLPAIIETPSPFSTATYTARLDAPSEIDIVVTLEITPQGTAEEADFITNPLPLPLAPTRRQFTILAGDTFGTMTLTAFPDTVNEPIELVDVAIVAADFADFSGATALTVRIIDDDPVPVVTLGLFDGTNLNSAETIDEDPLSANRTATIRASLDVASEQEVTVVVDVTSLLTAQESDFSTNIAPAGGSTLRTLTIMPGQTFADLELTAFNDAIDENAEELQIDIVGAQLVNAQLAAPQQVTVTINDDDPEPLVQLSVDSFSAVENSGTTVRAIATLMSETEKPVTVFLDQTGTATSGIDYNATQIPIEIPVGQTSGEALFVIQNDNIYEDDETIIVDIASVTNGVEDGVQQQTITIIEDEPLPVVSLAISSNLISENGGSVLVTASLDVLSALPVDVTFDYSGVAGLGIDYLTPPSAITIPAGSFDTSVIVQAIPDTLDEEDNESVIVSISGFTNSTLGAVSSVTASIVDDDLPALVSLLPPAAGVSESGATGTFTLELNTASGRDIFVDLAVVGGSSTATGGGVDYDDPTLTGIMIPRGTTSVDVDFVTVSDDFDEADETLTLEISNVVDGTPNNQSEATAIIIDDDDAPVVTLTAAPLFINEAGGMSTVTVEIDAISALPVTVDLALSGTADVAGGTPDYNAEALQLVVQPGDLTATMMLTTNQDLFAEPDETIIVDIANVSNGQEATVQQQTVTIIDDDIASLELVINRTSVNEIDGVAAAVGTVTRNTDLTVSMFVDITSSDSTEATAPLQVFIPVGATSASFLIAAVNDTVLDGTQTVTFTADAANHQSSSQDLDVLDSTFAVDLNVSAVTATETGQTAITIEAVAGAPVIGNQTVGLVISGTGITATDYTLDDDFLTIVDGQTTATTTLTILDDALVELLTETLSIEMVNASIGLELGAVTSAAITIEDNDSATVSIDNVSVLEGDAGSAAFVFTLTLSDEVDTDVLFEISTADGSATVADNDYLPVSGATLGFLAGQGAGPLVRTIAVQAIGDNKVELDEAFTVELSNMIAAGRNVTFANTSGLATITNEDAASISIADVSQTEGDSGNTVFSLEVTLDSEVDSELTVDFETLAGTATALAGDYLAITDGDVTFTANSGGSQVQTIDIQVIGDQQVEADETFSVQLLNLVANGRNVVIDDGTAEAAILNDDGAGISVDDVQVTEGDTGNSTLTFTVTLSSDLDQGVTVDYAFASDTATIGDDLTVPANGTLSFVGIAGETAQVSVEVAGDVTVERDETFFLNLSNLMANGRNVSISDSQGVGTITNDDSAEISINDVTANETDTGVTSLIFEVTMTGEVDTSVVVSFDTNDGTALSADSDYIVNSGFIRFDPNPGSGSQSRTFSVQVVGDRKVELDESFTIDLSNLAASGRNVTIAKSQGLATITNTDSAAISIADTSVTEGDSGTTDLTFTVTLDAEIDDVVTVDFASVSDTATLADGDYAADGSGTLTFAANSGGIQTATVTLVVNGDVTAETDESVLVNLLNLDSNGLNVSIDDQEAIGTIQNDDSLSVSVGDVTVAEGDSGATVATFTITLDGDSSADAVIGLSTASATAVANEDFTPVVNGTVTFVPGTGVRTQTFEVTVLGDEKVEADEIFQLNLSDAGSNGLTVLFSDDQALATVINDDSALVSIADVSTDEGSNGSTQLIFTVTLDSEIDVPLSLQYATADQTATIADNDYIADSGNLLFDANRGPGPQTKTVAIRSTSDTKVELDETFLVELSNLVDLGRSVTIGDDSGQATLVNDDQATVSVSDVSVREGDIGTTDLVFTVVLNGEVDAVVQVDSTPMESTALAGMDFQPGGTQSFSFAANGGARQVATFAIQVVGDDTVELDESFLVNLESLQDGGRNVVIGNGQASGIIENDDTANLSIADVQVIESDSGPRNITFTASLDSNVDVPFTVDYATADGVATVADGDYNAASGTLSFTGASGELRTFSVEVNGDSKVELDEGFLVGLLNLQGANRDINLTTGQAAVIIENDDAATISISNAGMVEGQTGTTRFDFVVTLDAEVDAPVGIQFATEDGTATADSGDYVVSSGSLSFTGTADERRTITVLVNGDGIVEEEEDFSVLLSGIMADGRDVTFADNRGTGFIGNEDTVLVNISDASVTEGHTPDSSFLTFTVTRSNTTIPIDIDFTSVDGTATVASGDYLPVSGTLNFPVGSPATANVVIEVLGDHFTESDETVFVRLSSTTSGVVIADGEATGTIVQDDGTVSGQKWFDENGNGIREVTEPGLDGWVIQLTNSSGQVVSQTTTDSIDLDGNGVIDPVTERGLYTLAAGNGDWRVREVLPQGWKQTSPGGGDALAFQLDQELNLRTSGNQFLNWGGLGEKWVFGSGDWYFITPTGNLFEWDGSPRSGLTGNFVAALGTRFYDTPSLLTNAQEAGQVLVTVTSNQNVSGVDFGNTPTGSIEGRKWHDADGDGRRDATEPWLNGWTIDLTDASGSIVGTAVTSDFDRNNDGQIDPATETGWYSFERIIPGDYTITERSQPLWTQAGSDGLLTSAAFELNQERQFLTPARDFLNWGGLQEKWLWGRGIGWHFVTPDGSVFEWNGSPRTALTGTLVTQLSSAYYEDLSLIFNPAQPSIQQVTITGQEVTGINFGNSFGHSGTGSGNVNVTVSGSNFTLTGDALDNSVAVYKDVNGNTLVTGIGETTLNGLDSPVVVIGDSPSITASLGSGNDQFVAYGISANSGVTVNTGAGIDRVTLGSLSAGGVSVSNTSGNDVLRLLQVDTGSLNVQGGGRVVVEESNITGNLDVEASFTSMLVIQDTSVSGVSTIQTGAAADAVIANRNVFGTLNVNSGSGSDLVSLFGNTVQGTLNVNTQNGNDTIGLRNSNSFEGQATIRGGRNTDTLASDGTSTVADTQAIESNDNSVLDGLIDTVLGNFDELLLDI